jgi:hypothetical protein
VIDKGPPSSASAAAWAVTAPASPSQTALLLTALAQPLNAISAVSIPSGLVNPLAGFAVGFGLFKRIAFPLGFAAIPARFGDKAPNAHGKRRDGSKDSRNGREKVRADHVAHPLRLA